MASDEVGRGNWAGPLITAAVCVPRGWKGPPGLTDSKKLDEKQRFRLRETLLKDPSVGWRIIWAHPDYIDRIGVHKANIEAHIRVHRPLVYQQSRVIKDEALHIADGNFPLGEGIISLPKADLLVPAVSAASILAKTTLDMEMAEKDEVYPGYGFAQNKGYGTPAHQEALTRLGPCPLHRKSFAPVKAALKPKTLFDLFDEMPE